MKTEFYFQRYCIQTLTTTYYLSDMEEVLEQTELWLKAGLDVTIKRNPDEQIHRDHEGDNALAILTSQTDFAGDGDSSRSVEFILPRQ